MATLVELATKARRKLGLETGEHTILCAGSTANDVIAVNDVQIKCLSSSAYGVSSFQQSGTAGTVASRISATIDALFTADSNIDASVDSATVTITGARKVEVVTATTSTHYTISSSNTTDEPPVFSDILEFVKEGQLDVANKVVNEVFTSDSASTMLKRDELNTSSATTQVSLPAEFLRPLELTFDSTVSNDTISRAEKVPYDLLEDIRNGVHGFYKAGTTAPVSDKFYSIYAGKIEISQNVFQHATDGMRLIYIRKPQTVVTTTCSLPDSLYKYVILYAVFNSLRQMGKDQEAMIYYQEYEQGLQSINAMYGMQAEPTFELPK